MARRLALPLGVLVLLAAILLVSARLGYLGRKAGGPLDYEGGYSWRQAGGAAPRWASIAWPLAIDGGAVRIVGGRPRAVSPGARVSRLRYDRSPNVTGRGRRWPPPRDDGPAAGRRLRSGDPGSLVVGLRARRPGVYLLDGYEVDYDQGARSYRRTFGQTLCANVGVPCADGLRLPRSGRIADLGGPSRYGVALRTADGEPLGRGTDRSETRALAALYPLEALPRRARVTFTNRTDEALRISRIGASVRLFRTTGNSLEPSGAFRVRGPDVAVTVPAHASRPVTLTASADGCLGDDTQQGTLEDLRATIDGERETVPLLVGIGFRTAERTC